MKKHPLLSLLALALVLTAFLVLAACRDGKKPAKESGTTADSRQIPVTTTSDTQESNTQITEGSDSMPESKGPEKTVGYTSADYAGNFENPGSYYRWHSMNHGWAKDAGTPSAAMPHLDNMEKQGVGGVVTNLRHNAEYLDSDENMAELNSAVSLLLARDRDVWLYDELGYPSGSAAGRVTVDAPEYVAVGLVCVKKGGSGKKAVSYTKAKDLLAIHSAYVLDASGKRYEASVKGDTASFEGTDGHFTLYVFCTKKLYEGTHAETNGCGGGNWLTRDYPNLLNRDAVRKFIDITYRRYAEGVKKFDRVTAVFTDEPSLMEVYQNNSDWHTYAQASYVEGLEEVFADMHGYSLAENLHCLFEGNDDAAKLVRVNYRQTVASLFSENYFAALRKFCEDNGTKSSGHLLLEESITLHSLYYGDLMLCLRQMSIPGADELTGHINSYVSSWPIYMAVKYASSAAVLTGKPDTMVEVCPTDLSNTVPMPDSDIRDFFATLNMIEFTGGNLLHSYKDISYVGKHDREFTDYLGRLSYMQHEAKWDGGIGVYYPINTVAAYAIPSHDQNQNTPTVDIQSNLVELTTSLYQHGMDFTVADNLFFEEATVENGIISNGNVSYSVLFMPAVEVLPLSVMQKLSAFTESGGTVYWMERLPKLADKAADTEALLALVRDLKTSTKNSLDYAVIREKAGYRLSDGKEGRTTSLYTAKYSLNGAPLYWCFNRSASSRTVSLSCPGAAGFDIYDPHTGAITSVSGETAEVTFEANSTLLIAVKE